MKVIKKKILFLHTELAEYFLACVNKLIELYPVEVHLVRLPINKEAPFSFHLNPTIHFYDRKSLSNKELFDLCKQINPDFIFCAGWIDPTYLKIAKHFHGRITTLLVLDNHWNGSVKQYAASILSPFHLLNKFSHIWIPGLFQYEYARRLGFKRDRILTGMYSADLTHFKTLYSQNRSFKQNSFPKRFVYIGRYVESKGVEELWEAFSDLCAASSSEWELWCAGTGYLEKNFPKHPKIKNFGFVQPKDLGNIIRETGVFVLPSYHEPWGVVVHEFAAAGFPLLCSSNVGAATTFLTSGYNGFSFQAKNKEALHQALLQITQMSDMQLISMSERSVELSNCINPVMWATKIWQLTLVHYD